MIFKRQWELVLSGQKTQTRRLWKPDWAGEWKDTIWKDRKADAWATEYFCLYRFIDPPTEKRRMDYWLDQLLPVIPKRTQPAIRMGTEMARVKVMRLKREPLQCMSEADAIAEGVSSIEAYKALWESMNGKTKGARWADNPTVVVISFERTPETLMAWAAATPGCEEGVG